MEQLSFKQTRESEPGLAHLTENPALPRRQLLQSQGPDEECLITIAAEQPWSNKEQIFSSREKKWPGY